MDSRGDCSDHDMVSHVSDYDSAFDDMESEDFYEDEELEDALIALILALVQYYIEKHLIRRIVHDASFTGNQVVQNMLNGHLRVCFDSCRFLPQVFISLYSIFRAKGYLSDSRQVSVEEQIRIFLQIIAHAHQNRSVQHSLQHSGETFSLYFNLVLDAICI